LKKKLTEEARKWLPSIAEGLHHPVPPGCSESWQWAVFALGYAYSDWKTAIRCFEKAICRQQPDGGIPLHLTGLAEPVGISLQERPYFAPMLWRLFETAPDTTARKDAMNRLLPALMAHQMYWYKKRDPRQEGLSCILHPLESPQPLATVWDRWQGCHESVKTAKPTKKENPFPPAPDLPGLQARPENGFEIQDPYHNALLALSNTLFFQMGGSIGMDMQELLELHELTVFSMNEKLWNEEYGVYSACDNATGKLYLSGSSGSWMPWIGAVPDQTRAEAMRVAFEANFHLDDYFLAASNSLFASSTDPAAPWRGAISLWDNWLLLQGLQRYDFNDLARILVRDVLTLCKEHGFQLHYAAKRAETHQIKYDADQVAPAAALIIALMQGKPILNAPA
jgi:hypothetical protein